MSKPAVGWIGLGIMGGAMARNLLRAGYAVVAFNRSRERAEAFARDGGRSESSPRAVARAAEIVFVTVADTPDVEQVLFGPDGVAEGVRSGAVVVDMGTTSPEATRGFAERFSREDVTYLDAPVSGGETGAREGALSIMVGGDARTVERCRPLFDVLGTRVTHLGPVGSGQSAKLANQAIVLGTLAAVCEGLLLGRASGLDGERLLAALSGGAADSWQLRNLGPKIAARDFSPGFLVSLARKDLRLVLETAEGLGLTLPVSALVRDLYAALGSSGEGTQALVTALENFGRRARSPRP